MQFTPSRADNMQDIRDEKISPFSYETIKTSEIEFCLDITQFISVREGT